MPVFLPSPTIGRPSAAMLLFAGLSALLAACSDDDAGFQSPAVPAAKSALPPRS